jgi:hypothetical protein
MNRDESDQNPSSGELMSSSLEDAEDDEWEEDERPASSAFVLPVVLFALTVFTVLWAGAYQTNTNPLSRSRGIFSWMSHRSLWSGDPLRRDAARNPRHA